MVLLIWYLQYQRTHKRMSDGSKCLHLKEDLACFKIMIPEWIMDELKEDNGSETILATEPHKYLRPDFEPIFIALSRRQKYLWDRF